MQSDHIGRKRSESVQLSVAIVRAAGADATAAITKLTEQICRVGPLLPQPIKLFEELAREAAHHDVDPCRVDQARATTGVLVAELRYLGQLYADAVLRIEEAIDATAQARATISSNGSAVP